MIGTTTFPLFDKIIDFTVYDVRSKKKFTVRTPRGFSADKEETAQVAYLNGVKPNIVVSGTVPANEVSANLTLKVTNLALPWALNEECWLTVEAGYAGSISTAFAGQITNSYQESSPPDGVMTIESLIGYADSWMFGTIALYNIKIGTRVNVVLAMIADALKMKLQTYLPNSLTFDVSSWSYTGSIQRCVSQLKRMFGFAVRRDAQYLICYAYGDTRNQTVNAWKPTFVTSVTKDAGNITLNCPWIPGMRPADLVYINSKYYAQSFGGAQTANYDVFQCGKIDFEFGTNTENSMTALLLAEADPTHGIDTSTAWHNADTESQK